MIKKLLLIAALFFTQTAIANPEKYLPLQDDGNGVLVRTYIRTVMKKEIQNNGEIDQLYTTHEKKGKLHILSFCLFASGFSPEESINSQGDFCDWSVKTCSLETKYKTLKGLFRFIHDEKNTNRVPVLLAQYMVDSFPESVGAEPELVLSHMRTFMSYLFQEAPAFPNGNKRISMGSWVKYALAQTENENLSEKLRGKFGKFASKLVKRDKRMNCALLGTGKQAVRLVQAIRETGCRIVSLYSRDIERGKRFVSEHKLPEDTFITDQRNQAIAYEGVDAVVVSTPDFEHYRHTMHALIAGKHVFLEKPIATDYSHAEELVAFSQERGLTLAIDYHMRWSLALRHLKDLIEKGELGTLQKVSIKWSLKPQKSDDWRNKENPWWCLSVLGTHLIDQTLWLFPTTFGPLKTFEGATYNALNRLKNEDSASLHFEFEKGGIVDVECDLAGGTPLTIQTVSEKGTFVFSKLLGEGQEISLPWVTTTFDYQNPWVESFRDFLNAVQEKRPPEVDLKMALRNLELMLKIKRDNSLE